MLFFCLFSKGGHLQADCVCYIHICTVFEKKLSSSCFFIHGKNGFNLEPTFIWCSLSIYEEEEEIWLLLLFPTQLLYSESLEEPGEGGDVEPCHWSILTPHCVVCQKRGDFWWRRSMNLSLCAPHTLGSYQFGIYFHSSYFKGIHVPNFSSLLLDS